MENTLYDLGTSLGSFFMQTLLLAAAILIPILFYCYCRAKVAVKMGDTFIAGFIPYVNDFHLFLRLWKVTPHFWLYPLCSIFSVFIPVIGSLIMIPIQLYLRTKLYWKLGKAFCKSNAFCFGLILLTPVFMAILAFGQSYYLQPARDIYNEPNRRRVNILDPIFWW